MIEHVWSIICGRSSTDRETNNLSIFDVIEQINVLGPLPDASAHGAIPIQYEVLSLWSRSQPAEQEESTGRISLLSPTGTEVFTQSFPVSLQQHERIRTQMKSMGFPILGAGRYVFLIEILRANDHWDTVARLPVQLVSTAPAPAPV